MLILTRRAGEALRIGDDVVLNILEMSGGQVRIGINAPKNVVVHREEIYERIQRGDPIIPKNSVESVPVSVSTPTHSNVHIKVKRRIGLN